LFVWLAGWLAVRFGRLCLALRCHLTVSAYRVAWLLVLLLLVLQEGSFRDGDIVRPQLAGPMGQALGHYIRPNSGGTGFSTDGVKWSEPVTQVMLLVNPHESAPASPHDA
jgi:hypothetical protein